VHDVTIIRGDPLRDGIYKNLPLGRGWKSLLKSCEREKERGETSRSKAARAIASEIGVELSPQFLQALVSRARRTESLLPGFEGIDRGVTCRDLGGTNSPFENDVLASAKRMEARGVRGRAIVDGALKESIETLKQRRVRQIEQHCLSNAGTKSKSVIDAARAAVSAVDVSTVTNHLMQGERPKVPRANREINLDEDLTQVR
jgi:hypothetical protein